MSKTRLETILKERAEADAKKKRILEIRNRRNSTIAIENNLNVVNELIREHGIVRHKVDKLPKRERFLNVLDVLYSKALTGDVRAATEYLNRTAGSVAQAVNLNETKKKLLVLGTGKTEEEFEEEKALNE